MRTSVSIAEDHIVPNHKPPFSTLLVKKSPTVAPRGLVSTKAHQNKIIGEIFVYL